MYYLCSRGPISILGMKSQGPCTIHLSPGVRRSLVPYEKNRSIMYIVY